MEEKGLNIGYNGIHTTSEPNVSPKDAAVLTPSIADPTNDTGNFLATSLTLLIKDAFSGPDPFANE